MQKITLDHPIAGSGRTITEVTMRRPKVKDMRLARVGNQDDAEIETRLFCNLCELAPDELDAMDFADYAKLQEAFGGFRS